MIGPETISSNHHVIPAGFLNVMIKLFKTSDEVVEVSVYVSIRTFLNINLLFYSKFIWMIFSSFHILNVGNNVVQYVTSLIQMSNYLMLLVFFCFAARKKCQDIVPLMRVDNDISNILNSDHKNVGNVFEMFVKYHSKLHCMRATEMNLKIHYHDDYKGKNMFLGNSVQLAKILLSKEDEIWEVK